VKSVHSKNVFLLNIAGQYVKITLIERSAPVWLRKVIGAKKKFFQQGGMLSMKISFLSSIRSKIVDALVLMAVVACIVTSVILLPTAEKNVDSVTRNYMLDLARSYGEQINNDIQDYGVEAALTTEKLTGILAGAGVTGVDSSYIYLVAADGTMLYHPTAEKIGQPVENAVVTEAVEKISRGVKVENEVIQYEFKGADKYAGIYTNDDQDFIVVVSADYDDVFANIRASRNKVIVAIIIIIILVLVVGSFFAYVIIKPINEAADITRKVADMDFTSDGSLEKLSYRKDETGRMGKALLELRDSLIEVVEEIKTKSGQVMDAAYALDTDASETATTMEQVERAVNEIADGATSQADETQRATEQVIQMGNMVQDTNEEVNNLLGFAQEMQECTSQARDILKELEQINQRAGENIDVIAEQTNTTNAAAQKISEATHLITSIAEETNLLALNASIEAARAGEQGKGFGVVATEIQKLAEQTNQSAVKIEEIVDELLADSEKAVETMYEVREIGRVQSDYVEQTQSAFSQVSSGVDQSINGINRISEKTRMLDEARTNVVDIVQNLTAIAEQNAAGTEETSASTTEVSAIVEDITGKSGAMKNIAKELEEGMNIFKI
jgi:methyl-accepting chemotaxis protein